ncbi:hypothetical protein BX600DRAFT_402504 [Xylariales sp. PMI_506]|nr:hypothetical protein BX600DRAFT_402504 [Xylariales sp. PMI_506]
MDLFTTLRESGLSPAPMLGLVVIGSIIYVLCTNPRVLKYLSSKSAGAHKPDDEKAEFHPSAIVFPPSRRPALAQVLPGSQIATTEVKIDAAKLRSNQIPTTRTQDLNQKDLFTPTGILTQEIKALGRFPDYSLLSGVPHPQPAPDFDIHKTSFRPFRPFRWNYHQTMALMKYQPDYWIELEHNYFRRMEQRLRYWKEHGERVMFHAPGSELASRELMEMVLQFLCIRYPHYFQLEDDNTVFRNRLLDKTTVIDSMHPLEVLYHHVPEDFNIMCRSEEDGQYYLRSAMVCSSIGWNVGQHKNKLLRRIHDNVPLWEEKMAFSVDRWFTKLPVDQPVQRCSWGLEDWEALFAPEDQPRSAFHDRPSEVTVDDIQLRCDWQTLRRLPISGAIIFNFKAVFTPLAQLAAEPHVPALLLTILNGGQRVLIDYKVEKHVEKVAVEALEGWAKKQVEDGVVPADWEVGTLEQHPYYPGWQEMGDLGACPMR